MVSERELAEIIRLAQAGMSREMIGKRFGKSRGAISGLIYRAGITTGRNKNPRKRPVPKKYAKQMPETNNGITIFKLNENTCRYMIGHHKYCGHAVEYKSYCMAHAKECYNLDAIKKHRRKKA